MGLLDFLSGQSDGQPNPLLQFLQANAAAQQQPGGLPSDQANYAPMGLGGPAPSSPPLSPGGTAVASNPLPGPAPTPAPSASSLAPMSLAGPPAAPVSAAPAPAPVQPTPPQAAPVVSHGIGDRLGASVQSFANTTGGGIVGKLINGVSSLVTGQRTDGAGIAQNANVAYLRSKGVPETEIAAAIASPELYTQELKKYGPGPHTAENLGEGYLRDPYTGKVTRAYTPEDKTPTSILEYQYYLKSVPKGEQPIPYQQWFAAKEGGPGLSLNPIYGKDAAGNTILLQPSKTGVAVQSKLPEGVTLNGVDNETLASDAKRLNEGDDTILKKYSNKGQGRVDLLRLNNEANRQRQEEGKDPIDITQNRVALQGDIARERAAGNMEGRMAPAAVEAQGAFKIAREASDNLARENFVPYNKILQAGQSAFSNPELKAAATAYNTAVMTYSKAITPTGVGTVTAQEHARQILETADGPAATKAAFDQLSREVDMAHQSPALARQYFADARKAKMEGRPPPPMPQYSEPAKSYGAGGDSVLAQARDAIAKGAPRDAVVQRLQQSGIDPGDL